jgi:hypothetical protein
MNAGPRRSVADIWHVDDGSRDRTLFEGCCNSDLDKAIRFLEDDQSRLQFVSSNTNMILCRTAAAPKI